MVVRFEKSGATALANLVQPITLDQPGLTTVDRPSVALIREHFRTALIIHVRGFSKRPTAGSLMI